MSWSLYDGTPEQSRKAGQVLSAEQATEVLQQWARTTRFIRHTAFGTRPIEVTDFQTLDLVVHDVAQISSRETLTTAGVPDYPTVERWPTLPTPTGRKEKFRFLTSGSIHTHTCTRCNGNRGRLCPTEVACPRCGGRGNVGSVTIAHHDHRPGITFVQNEHRLEVCPSCTGRGRQICHRCNGSGWATCGGCGGGGTQATYEVLTISRSPVKPQAHNLPRRTPFRLRQRDWEHVQQPGTELTDTNYQHWLATTGTAAPGNVVSRDIDARVAAVTCAQYVDQHGVSQSAWIIGPHHRVMAPAATRTRRLLVRALILAAAVALIAITASLAISTSESRDRATLQRVGSNLTGVASGEPQDLGRAPFGRTITWGKCC